VDKVLAKERSIDSCQGSRLILVSDSGDGSAPVGWMRPITGQSSLAG
jgi:hypothetical protein